MRRFVKAALAAATVCGLGFASQACVAPAADDPSGLASQATIRRDTFGIPHIHAETEEAAAFAFGFAQAEDHAVEIARRLIRARGEAAKYLGSEEIENDFAMRRFANIETAEADLSRVSPFFAEMLHAYAAGVNRYVELNRAALPSWIPVFTAADVLANIRAIGVRSASSAGLVRRLSQKYPGATTEARGLPPEEDAPGSNAFAVAGSHTTSGSPILMANPHLSWASRYWEAHLTVPGKVNFFGNTLVGYPVLWAGFNDRLGWANTVNAADLEDVFALTLDPERPDHYIFEGRSMPLESREVAIEVKNADGTLDRQQRTYWSSHLGAIVHRTPAKAFAIKSMRLESHLQFEGFYRLSRTRNLEEFLETMRTSRVYSCNFVYADVDGNILYLWNAQIPRRVDDGTNYALDVPGDSGKYVWSEVHPLKDLPRLLNPPGGYVHNANNPPWYTSKRDRLDPSAYPAYFDRGTLSLRAQLGLDLLESAEQFSVDEVNRLKHSTRLLLAERVKPDLLEAVRKSPRVSPDARAGLEALQAWDDRVSIDSRGAVLFQRFWDEYSAAAKQPFRHPWNAQDPWNTPRGIGDPVMAVKQLEAAVRWTRETYGNERVAWGDVHRIRIGDLDLPGDGASGDYGAYRVMRYQQTPGGQRVIGIPKDGEPMGFGDGWIMVMHFTNPLSASSVLAYGQTFDPASAHSRDQLQTFARHELRPVFFTEDEVKANTQRTYHPGAAAQQP
ncbi:MAG TPA: penicillin acylase family protein [Vicinamibacterales bacterium]